MSVFHRHLHLLLPKDVNSMALKSSVLTESPAQKILIPWEDFGSYCTARQEYQLLSCLFHRERNACWIFPLAVFSTDGKLTNRIAWILDLNRGWESNNSDNKPQSLSLQEFTVINCQFLSLFPPANRDSRRLFHLVNNLFYTTGSKEDEFISISNLDEERVEHLVCSEGTQAASSIMIFHKLQLSGMLGFVKLSQGWKHVYVHFFFFKAVRFMPKSTES